MIDVVLEHIYEEVLKTQDITGETDITIFLSAPLFHRIHVSLDQLMLYTHSDFRSVKLFGCNVERYEDQGLAFYVTTAKKISFSNKLHN